MKNQNWFSEAGADNFGRWAELEIGGVPQRLRWIAPGEFWMGSPPAEEGRADERPRHRVRLTQGYWLADTACSQALWLAVVGGDNPSYFKGDLQCPVEQVSWDDVQEFLRNLAQMVGAGVVAELPTEAEWEYACRAGTQSAFAFGETVTPEQVNYNGNHPYGGAAKGEYRARTPPVKALAANAWGLYQMHGNVWEWCADGKRNYAEAASGDVVIDPRGPEPSGEEGALVLRGGSWGDSAWSARAASRTSCWHGERYREYGFRFALRATEALAHA